MTPNETSNLFDWSTLVPTLVGGAVTLAGTLLAWKLNDISDRRRRLAEQQNVEASNVFSGYVKLKSWTNLVFNIEHHIDQQFRKYHAIGIVWDEAFQYVSQGVGKFILADRLTAAELEFLFRSNNHDLLEDIRLVEARAGSLLSILEKYNELRAE